MSGKDDCDLEVFLDGLAFYSKLSFEEMIDHLKANKVDQFCDFPHPNGVGILQCTRKGYFALRSLVLRRIDLRSDGRKFDVDEVFESVRKQIATSLKKFAPNGAEAAFEEAFDTAIASSLDKQSEHRFHLPCVLVGSHDSPSFTLGPVFFNSITAFGEYLEKAKEMGKEVDAEVDGLDFKSYAEKYGTIATVAVPRCSKRVARARAELAARTAINVVRIWFGQSHGQRMRLVHTDPATSSFTHTLEEDGTGISFLYSRSTEGASVAKDWPQQLGNLEEHRKMAAWLLRDIVHDETYEYSDRLVDALSWFGDAAFEPSPGAKLAKLTILLERLTATSASNSKLRFCRHVAILAMDDDADLEAKFWAAYDLYNSRSEVVHGVESQMGNVHWKALSNSESLIVNSLFRGFEIYSLMRFPRNQALPQTPKAFFDQQVNRLESKFVALAAEFSQKEDLRRKARPR